MFAHRLPVAAGRINFSCLFWGSKIKKNTEVEYVSPPRCISMYFLE